MAHRSFWCKEFILSSEPDDQLTFVSIRTNPFHKPDDTLPTQARGLFAYKTKNETWSIAARGYDMMRDYDYDHVCETSAW